MEYNFTMPELSRDKEGIINTISYTENAIKYWYRVKNGNGYDWEKKHYTHQYLDEKFIDANIDYFNEMIKTLKTRLSHI